MTDERESMRDEELERLLARWAEPAVPEGMDERVMAAFRRETASREKAPASSLWQRLLTSSIPVPVPVALAVALVLLFSLALALRPTSPPPTAGTSSPSGPVQAARQGRPVETGSSLAGFQAVTEITATVVQEGTP